MQSDATTVEDYIAEAPEHRRDAIRLVHDRILALTPGVQETLKHGMPYYEHDGESFIAVASQKQYLSLYVRNLQESLDDEEIGVPFHGVSCGKGCLRFRDSQLDLLTAEALDPLIEATRDRAG